MEEEPPSPTAPLRQFRSGGVRWRGFADAWRGIVFLVRREPNARLHLLATVCAGAVGGWLGLSAGEWAAVVCSMVAVWVSEALNTAIEMIVDLISPEWRALAGAAKDVAAGAVLLAAFGAAVVGLVVFGPKLWAKL